MLSFFRTDLLRVLFQAAQPDQVYQGLRCSSIKYGDRQVSVVLSDSTEITGDILIAADGVNSIARKTLFPHISKRYLGHISLGGSVRREHAVHNYVHGLNRTCVAFPCTQTHCHTVMFLPKPRGWLRANTTNFEEQRALFKGWSSEVDRVLDNLEESNRFCVESHEIPPLPCLAKNRIFLVGDAAHAMSPLGALATSLALEDIRDLRRVLSKYPTIESAEQAYTALRSQRIAELRDFSLKGLVPSIVSHGPTDFAKRMERFSSLPSYEVWAPQRHLLQRELQGVSTASSL